MQLRYYTKHQAIWSFNAELFATNLSQTIEFKNDTFWKANMEDMQSSPYPTQNMGYKFNQHAPSLL